MASDRLTKTIYKYLDLEVGKEFYISVTDEIDALDNFQPVKVASLISKNGSVVIMCLVYKKNNVFPYIKYGSKISENVCSFFSININSAYYHVQNWFKKKHNLETIIDIDKFVKHRWEQKKSDFDFPILRYEY